MNGIISKLLYNNCFALQQQVATWQEVVYRGCEMPQTAGVVTSKYFSHIIHSTHTYGPYYVIAPNVAIPHARPEHGALISGISLVTLKKGVHFGSADNDPVDFVLTFAAKNKREMNESIIVQIMELLDNEKLFTAMRTAETEKDLRQLTETKYR